MGLLNRFRAFRRLWQGRGRPVQATPRPARGPRICRFEQVEPRRFLSAAPTPIQIGSVYYEDATQEDQSGDLIEITWSGGAPGTQLVELSIETDKLGDGLTIGDCLFDTAPGGAGAYNSRPLEIIGRDGIDAVDFSVADGGTRLAFTFHGFDPGERLVFSIDVDEMGFLGPNAVAEGNEWEGTRLSASFTAPHYVDASAGDIYVDFYDAKLAGSGLALPPDNYVPPGLDPQPVLTAGAFASLTQVPLPITLAGTVFEDFNANNVQEAGDPGIPGVQLTLEEWQGTGYVSTGLTTSTDATGQYRFEGLLPGVYRVVETQPGGYLSVGARAGTVGGQTRGVVVSPDLLSDIHLEGGDDSVRNDFAEARPASISGHVYEDDNRNGVRDEGEAPIAGVELALLDAGGNPTGMTTTTDASGFYSFVDLKPGTYGVAETQPDDYFDGLDAAGTAGGTPQNPGDTITGAILVSGTKGQDYDFGEIRPAGVCGRVYVDLNNNGVYDAGETPLPGATVYLLDAAGNRIAERTTNEEGRYCFRNLEPGTYGVEEVQPQGYLDGQDQVGTAGGTPGNDRTTAIKLYPGTHGQEYNFGELLPAKISGYVFQDGPPIVYPHGATPPDTLEALKTRDGVLDASDKRLSGVVLTLGDALGEPVLDVQGQPITTVTNEEGYYEFTNLLPGVYTVVEVHPEGYVDGLDTAGSKGGVAVNVTEPVDPDVVVELVIDPKDDAILRIPIDAGDDAANYNFSEIVLEEGPPTPPPPPPPPPPDPPPQPPIIDPPSQSMYWDRPVPVLLTGWSPVDSPRPLLEGGGGLLPMPPFTWHLSVINAGRPRKDQQGDAMLASLEDVYFTAVSWSGKELDTGRWILADGEGRPMAEHVFGLPIGVPVTGDWSGDGTTKIGLFYDGFWFLDLNGNGQWDKDDLWARLGQLSDRPVTGDWDGDGKTDIGIFGAAWAGDARALQTEPGLPDAANRVASVPRTRYKNIPPEPEEATSGWRTLKRTSVGAFRKDLIDHVFRYGEEGHVPITGDWNGDGVSSIGIFHNGTWYLDADGDGRWSAADVKVTMGQSGDVPVVGDWNGDGATKLGVYRNGTWILDVNGDRVLDAHDKVLRLGGPGDVPVVGDWNADGIDEIGVYRAGSGAVTREASAQPPLTAPQAAEPVITR